MKGSARAAAAIGLGYVLGRRRKMRTATVMAIATAAGGTSVGGMLLRGGAKMLDSADLLGKISPQVADLADTVRGDLLDAGKAAATGALTSRVDMLTDSIHERAERVRNPGAAVAEGTEQAASAGRQAGSSAARGAGSAVDEAGGAARAASRRGRGRGREYDERDDDERDANGRGGEDAAETDDYEAGDAAAEVPEESAGPLRRSAPRRRPAVTRARR